MPRFKHQKSIFEKTRDLIFFALSWKMRVGKTKPMVDTAIYLHETGKIDAVLLAAPNGVHLNWAKVEIPDVLAETNPDELFNKQGRVDKDFILVWSSQKKHLEKFKKDLDKAIKFKGLVWFCFNIEAIWTRDLEKYLDKFIAARKCLFIIDEAHKIKNPKAKTTKAALAHAKEANVVYRRTLTGTPISKGPFDFWSQYCFLSWDILKMTFSAFKQRFGVFAKGYAAGGRTFMQVVEYKDLPHLQELIAPYTSRLTYPEVAKDIAETLGTSVRGTKEPIPEIRYFELSDAQRKAYDELVEEYITTLPSGEVISANMVLTCRLRLHQISRGFVSGIPDPHDPDGYLTKDLGSPHPAIDALWDIIADAEGKVIVWCRFKDDVDLILNDLGPELEKPYYFVRYDGNVKGDQRFENLQKMKNDPYCKGLIGTPAAGGIGIDISSADTMVFYSHNYNYVEREQAIARILGPNQKSDNPLLIDLVAADTVDENCLGSNQKKDDMSKILTGDRERLAKFLRGEKICE